MKKDSKYIWYFLDTIVFLAINVWIWMRFPAELQGVISMMSWTVIIILSLGIYRLTDIITQENVTEFMRAPFMNKRHENDRVTWEMSNHGLKGFFGNLFSCNACMGVWISMIVFYLFAIFPTPTLAFMIIMTLTCFERFLSKIYNFLEKRG